jgi:16S rRNA U516 pseudouridylate synthase RsuA-like enzyme
MQGPKCTIQIRVTAGEHRRAKRLAAKQGCSVAELIRRTLDQASLSDEMPGVIRGDAEGPKVRREA